MEKTHSINFSCQNFSIENIYFSSREKRQWLTPYSEVGLLLFDKVFSLKNMSFWCTVIALYCALFWRGIHYQCSLLSYMYNHKCKIITKFLIVLLYQYLYWDCYQYNSFIQCDFLGQICTQNGLLLYKYNTFSKREGNHPNYYRSYCSLLFHKVICNLGRHRNFYEPVKVSFSGKLYNNNYHIHFILFLH